MTLADLIARAGLPADTLVTSLPGLTWHTTKPLTSQGVATVGELAKYSDGDLLTFPGMGPRRLAALKTAIEGQKP